MPPGTANGADAMLRRPHFGLGTPATESELTRSADLARCPSIQGGAYARCTHAALALGCVVERF